MNRRAGVTVPDHGGAWSVPESAPPVALHREIPQCTVMHRYRALILLKARVNYRSVPGTVPGFGGSTGAPRDISGTRDPELTP